MAGGQLDLFNRRKFTGIQPQGLSIAPPTGDATILKTLPAYHVYLSSGGYSKYTPDDFTSDVKKFGVFVKEKKLQELQTVDLQQWIAQLKKVMSAKTVSRKVSALTNYFQWLVAERVFETKTNPASGIYHHRVTSPLPEILFENECQQLLKTASTDARPYFLVLLLLETGLKKEELFELKTAHFDLSNRYAPELWVKHAGKKITKDRKIKLPAEIVAVYEEYVKKYEVAEVVFPYTPRFIEMLLSDVAGRAGLRKKVTAGILRDTFVVRSLRKGEALEYILTFPYRDFSKYGC
jgi:integrase/recombinase XerD